MNKKKKIGIIVRSLPVYDQIGGSEKQAVELAQELSKKYEVTLFSRKWKSDIEKFAAGYSYKVKTISFVNIPFVRYISYVFFGLAELKKYKNNLKILLCFGFGPEVIISYFGKKYFNIPYVICIRAEGFNHRSFSVWRHLIQLVIKNAYLVVAQTERMKQLFQNKYNNKTVVIPNGIRPVREIATGDRIVYAGRLIRNKSDDKGVRYLIKALKKLNVESLIIGYGPEEKRLKNLSKGLKIEFTGKVKPEDMIDCLKKGKIFVFPSLTEGFPNVIIEAMSVGLPVIATKVGGIPDIITHGKTGFLVETRNSDQIQKYVELLLKDDGLYTKMRKNCLLEVRKYYWSNVISYYDQILFDLC